VRFGPSICAALFAQPGSTPTAVGRDDAGAVAVGLRDVAAELTIANDSFETSWFGRQAFDL
jgi:hypothetical protein